MQASLPTHPSAWLSALLPLPGSVIQQLASLKPEHLAALCAQPLDMQATQRHQPGNTHTSESYKPSDTRQVTSPTNPDSKEDARPKSAAASIMQAPSAATPQVCACVCACVRVYVACVSSRSRARKHAAHK